jgi:hypothetical protein
VNLLQPLNTLKYLRVFVPANAELEAGYRSWIFRMVMLQEYTKATLQYFGGTEGFKHFQNVSKLFNTSFKSTHFLYNAENEVFPVCQADSLNIVIGARQSTISFAPSMENLIAESGKNHNLQSFLIFFPEQNPKYQRSGMFSSEDLHLAPLQDKLEKISHLKKFIGRIFNKK